MLMNPSRPQVVIGVWMATLVASVTLSVWLGQRWSTTAALFVVLAAPVFVARLLGYGRAQAMSTHDVLYATDARSDRRP
jgi:hypothetical protein